MGDEIASVKNQTPGLCPDCQSGISRLRYITYFTWLNEELITVSNFPAWVCDVCGRREYDSRAVSWLNTLLSPETGKSRTSHGKHKPPNVQRSRSRKSL